MTASRYLYKIGDVIQTDDDRIGMIYSQTNATELLALVKEDIPGVFKVYENILVYKVLLNGTITYVHESNIKDIVCTEKRNM